MFSLLCLGATLSAYALDPSVRSWLEAEALLEAGRPTHALPALAEAEEGVVAPLAALQVAMLRQSALTEAPETVDAFVSAVDALGEVRYDSLRALSLTQPGAAPGFDRAVVSRSVYADTAAALTLQAAVLLDARGERAAAEALRERIIAQWPESTDGRYLRTRSGVAIR